MDSPSDGTGEYGIVELDDALLFWIGEYGTVVAMELSLLAELSDLLSSSLFFSVVSSGEEAEGDGRAFLLLAC